MEFDKHLAEMTDHLPLKFKKLMITITYRIAKNFVISKFRQWGILSPARIGFIIRSSAKIIILLGT
jgi:hypothetical protein